MYHLLPLPPSWEVRQKDLDTKDFIHNKKHIFGVPPCFVYLHAQAKKLKERPVGDPRGLGDSKPTQKMPLHVHKDKDGRVHQTNMITFLEMIDSGQPIPKEYMSKSDSANNWQRFMGAEAGLKRLIAPKPVSLQREPNNDTIFKLASPTHGQSKESTAYKFIRSMKNSCASWSRGRAAVESHIGTAAEQSYYNSDTDQRGYAFKVNPRLRASGTSALQRSLMSAASESKFARTQTSFGHSSSKGILKFRIDTHPVVMKPGNLKDSKGFYVDRLPEREFPQAQAETKPVMTIEDGEGDVFEQWQKQHPEEFKKEGLEPFEEEDHDPDQISDREGVPVPVTQSHFRTTTQDYFQDYQRKEELVNFMPRVQTLGTESLKRAMIRTSSSKFFTSIANTTGDLQKRMIRDVRSTTSFAKTSQPIFSQTQTNLGRYSRLEMRANRESTLELLAKRATRDAAREYEELGHAKARLASVSKSQSLASLRRALLTPDTSFYRDITNLPIPSNGSRLLAYEIPAAPKVSKKKPVKKPG